MTYCLSSKYEILKSGNFSLYSMSLKMVHVERRHFDL